MSRATMITLRRVGLASMVAAAAACSTPSTSVAYPQAPGDGPRVLAVTAHPDDEIAFAATLFKVSTHLGGTCDIAVITNGEGGYKYSTLGELMYGRRLTSPPVGRSQLPGIRRKEMLEGCAILRVRNVTFLAQRDHRFTLDADEVLATDARVWDLPHVRETLADLLAAGDYDFVLTHLPVPETHGHHKAATVLALNAVRDLPLDRRPIVLGAFPSGRDSEAPSPRPDPSLPIAAIDTGSGPWTFDRKQSFGYKDRLNYQIVVNWAIAAHKSQGTMQLMMNRWDKESYYLYALPAVDARARTTALFERLAEPQFTTPEYDENGDAR